MASNSNDLNKGEESLKSNDKRDVFPNDEDAENVKSVNNTSNFSDLNSVKNSEKCDDASLNDNFNIQDLQLVWSRLKSETSSTNSSIRITESNPEHIAKHDSRNESVIQSETKALQKSLQFCDKIVDACFKISNYVPDLSVEKNSAFWLNGVIPILSENITNIQKCRVIVSHAIASVRQLGIAILRGTEIIYETQGSATAVKIARENITISLDVVEKWIKEIENLEGLVSIEIFERQINKIFGIIGPEAAKFVEERSNIESQIHDKEKDILLRQTYIYFIKGQVARYKELVAVMNKYRSGRNLDTNEGRTETLGESIQENAQEAQSTATSSSNIENTSNTTRNVEEILTAEERDGNEETEFYEILLRARIKRKIEDKDVHYKKTLNEDLNGYKTLLKEAEAELKTKNKSLKRDTARLDKDIDLLNKKLEEIKEKQYKVEKSIGLQGPTLIQCLTDIRTFGRAIEKGTSGFSPLVGILKDVKQMVQSDMQLLLSTSNTDVAVAASRLMRQVRFLSKYAVDANNMLTEASPIPTLAIEDCEEAVEFDKTLSNTMEDKNDVEEEK